MRLLAILILGSIFGFFGAYTVFFHEVPLWMSHFLVGGMIGAVLGIMLIPNK